MESKIIRLPAPLRNRFGLPAQIALVPDNGDASFYPGGMVWNTRLLANHFRGEHLMEKYDLGSGLVTNVGCLAMSNDWNWASPSAAAVNILKLANFHATGTGTNAAARSDITLQTLAAPTTTTAVTGTQTVVQSADLSTNTDQAILQSVATISYGSTLAITEWGLHNAATLSATTGTPFTATTVSTGTVTGTPLTASSTTVQGSQQMVVKAGTTTVWGLVFSNTTSVFTFRAGTTGGWYTVASGATGSTPGATEAFSIVPVLWDRKQFAAINVVSGDSIQFTYQLTIRSGG